jgi:lipopolysaccharide O-acetyltransferase
VQIYRGIKIIILRIIFSSIDWFAGFRDKAFALSLVTNFSNHGMGMVIRYPADIVGAENISIGDGFVAGRYLRLEAIKNYNSQNFKPEIVIGSGFACHNFVHIGAVNKITIGNNVLIGSQVTIVDHNHGYYDRQNRKFHENSNVIPTSRKISSSSEVIIGNNVWIGDGAIILPGSNIGDGAIIGANSVIKGKIPTGTIMASSIAKPIKEYSRDRGEWISIKDCQNG